jgi:hypothetical protein
MDSPFSTATATRGTDGFPRSAGLRLARRAHHTDTTGIIKQNIDEFKRLFFLWGAVAV